MNYDDGIESPRTSWWREKNNNRERFCENISWHVFRRYPGSRKWASLDMVTDKMMADINMFGTSWNRRSIGKSTSCLIIAKDRKGTRDRETQNPKKSPKPKRFLKSMSHSIVFSFSRWQRNWFLLDSWPRYQRSLKIERITRNTMPACSIRGPIRIRASHVLDITT